MSNNNHEELRLLSLVAAFKSVAKPALTLEQLLDLAFIGGISLYVRLPPGMVAHVDPWIPIITHRRSGPYQPPDQFMCRYSPRFGQIHPEVTHVALDPDQANDLKLRASTDETAFSSGLSPHPDRIMAEAGWLAPCQFDTSLVICPAFLTTDAERRSKTVRRKWLKATLEDIQVDERILDLIDGSQDSRNDDPYFLRDRSHGMYVLYLAARRYYAALKAKTLDITVVEAEVLKQLPELGAIRVSHAVRLIKPVYRRNSGVPGEIQKPFGADVLNQPHVRRQYLQEGFITEPLALALHVTTQWLEARENYKEAPSMKGNDRKYLEVNFEKAGFYKKQGEALVRVAMWPEK